MLSLRPNVFVAEKTSTPADPIVDSLDVELSGTDPISVSYIEPETKELDVKPYSDKFIVEKIETKEKPTKLKENNK